MRLGIQAKWALLSAVAVGVATIPPSVSTVLRVYRQMESDAHREAESVVKLLASVCGEPMVDNDDLAIDRALNAALASGYGVRYAVVLSPDGTIVASRPEIHAGEK